MSKTHNILGVIGTSVIIALSLSGCGMRSLPDEERYQYIDNVLETIDYKTVGDIVKEEIDNGDGTFAPSYKVISYGNEGSFDELEKRLRRSFETCSGDIEFGQVNCSYGRTSVSVFYNKKANSKSDINSIISVTDSSSGKG